MSREKFRDNAKSIEIGRHRGGHNQRFLAAGEGTRTGKVGAGRNQPSGKEVSDGAHVLRRLYTSPWAIADSWAIRSSDFEHDNLDDEIGQNQDKDKKHGRGDRFNSFSLGSGIPSGLGQKFRVKEVSGTTAAEHLCPKVKGWQAGRKLWPA